MGWLAVLTRKVLGADTTDWTLVTHLDDPGLGIAGSRIEADECYVEIFVESMRMKQARRFGTQFHGLVYSFTRLSQEAAEDAQLAAVSKPEKLANMDGSNLDRVITVSNRMMGAVPWRGGTLGLELGLFCVKKGNLLTPLVDYVARVSEQGGISFIGQVKPFLPLITEGMDLIAGQSQDSVIEVALDTDMSLKVSCLCAILAVPKGNIDVSRLTLDLSDRKLLLDGQPLHEAYCVFSIRHTEQKADYGAIPELKAAWAILKTGIMSGKEMQAEEALSAFRRTVLVCPDLITRDRIRLIEKATELMRAAFPSGPGPVGRDERSEFDSLELRDLELYE